MQVLNQRKVNRRIRGLSRVEQRYKNLNKLMTGLGQTLVKPPFLLIVRVVKIILDYLLDLLDNYFDDSLLYALC